MFSQTLSQLRERRRRAHKPGVTFGSEEVILAAQQRLMHVVNEIARQLVPLLDGLHNLHQQVMHSIQEYLETDCDGVDSSLLARIQECAVLFESFEQLIKGGAWRNTLAGLEKTCDRTLSEREQMCQNLHKRDDAFRV